jgi:hypothetical protein
MLETPVGKDVIDSEQVARVPPTFRDQLDLLFVLDDTEDMAVVQEHLVSMWQRMRGHLAFAEGGFPDVRIGVTPACRAAPRPATTARWSRPRTARAG